MPFTKRPSKKPLATANILSLSLLTFSFALTGCNDSADPVPDPMEPQAAGALSTVINQVGTVADIEISGTRTMNASTGLTEDGYGPYRIGNNLEDTGLATGTNVAEQGDCLYATNGEDRDILFMLIDNKLARIDVMAGDLSMPSGVGLGSSGDEVKSAYADKLVVTPGKYEATLKDYTVTFPGNRGAVFQVQNNKVQSYRVGQFPQVSWVEGCL